MVLWICAVLLLLMVLWTLLRWLPAGWDGHAPLPYLIALIPFLWMPNAIIALIALAHHAPALTVAALLNLLWLALLRLPHYRGVLASRADTHETTDDHPTIRVMTLNCRFGRAQASDIVAAVQQYQVDVLMLQELSESLLQQLHECGLTDRLAHQARGRSTATDNGGFNAVCSRLEPSSATSSIIDMPAAEVPALTVTLPAVRQPVTLVSVHPKSPMRGCKDWSAGIRRIGELTRTTAGQSLIVAGDCNSNTNHPSFRAMLAAGLRDASLVIAHGTTRTFPSWMAWPRIELDHVLLYGPIQPYDIATLPISGSDHLAILVTLAVDSSSPQQV